MTIEFASPIPLDVSRKPPGDTMRADTHPVRALHLTAGNMYGGVERVLTTLADCRHLYPSMVPAFGVCFPGRQCDELLAVGVPVFDLGPVRLSRPWTVLAARRKLKRVLESESFDVVVTHQSWPHAVFAPVIRIPVVHFAHGPLGQKRTWLERLATRNPPKQVLANSSYTASLAEGLFPGVRTTAVGLPVRPPAAVDREAVRKAMNADGVVILHAARLSPWKGQRVLLDAAARLRDVPGWQVWFAGGPQTSDEEAFLKSLEERATQHGIADWVRFLGQRADVPALMAAADIYCQPNTDPEPFGVSLVEALYAGRPVVTADVGGGAEVVTLDCGRLVPPGDVAATAAVLRTLIQDAELRAKLGDAGPGRARELCDPAGRLAALAKELAA